jgi:hypothetical protein
VRHVGIPHQFINDFNINKINNSPCRTLIKPPALNKYIAVSGKIWSVITTAWMPITGQRPVRSKARLSVTRRPAGPAGQAQEKIKSQGF